MNRDEEISLLRRKQIEIVKKRSLGYKVKEAFKGFCLAFFSIGAVYGVYHAILTLFR